MSYPGNFMNNRINNSPSMQNKFHVQPQKLVHFQSGNPTVYPPAVLRTDMYESEPMSEYSEMIRPTVTRFIPNTFRQATPHQESLPQVMVQRNNPSAYSQGPPLYNSQIMGPKLMPLPSPIQHLQQVSPQYLSTPHQAGNYNPDQSFVMQSTSQGQPHDSKKNAKPSSVVPKTDSPKTSNFPGNKLNSVNRRRFFIGSVDQVVRWHKIAKKAQLYALYKVAAILENISRNTSGVYKLILRSEQKNNTPPLQAVFYAVDRDLPKIKPGELITCVGRMVGANKLQIYDIYSIQSDNLAGLKRISFLCQRTLQETYLASPEP